MAAKFIGLDLTQDPGSRLSPEMQAEIALVAPSTVTAGSITTIKLDQEAVTAEKIAPGAVGKVQIAEGGVESVNIKANAVTTEKIDDNAVGPDQTGVGVVTAADSAGNAVAVKIVYVTAAQYAGLSSPDPNVEYHIS